MIVGFSPVKVGHRQTPLLQKKPVRRTGFFVEDPGQGRSLRPAGLQVSFDESLQRLN